MPEFLSPEWISSLDVAIRSLAATYPRELGTLVVEQVVTGSPRGEVRYHLALGVDARVQLGPAHDPDLVVTTDFETARAMHGGERTAESSLAAGRLSVRGRFWCLRDHGAALSVLADVFAPVRSDTTHRPRGF